MSCIIFSIPNAIHVHVSVSGKSITYQYIFIVLQSDVKHTDNYFESMKRNIIIKCVSCEDISCEKL